MKYTKENVIGKTYKLGSSYINCEKDYNKKFIICGDSYYCSNSFQIKDLSKDEYFVVQKKFLLKDLENQRIYIINQSDYEIY